MGDLQSQFEALFAEDSRRTAARCAELAGKVIEQERQQPLSPGQPAANGGVHQRLLDDYQPAWSQGFFDGKLRGPRRASRDDRRLSLSEAGFGDLDYRNILGKAQIIHEVAAHGWDPEAESKAQETARPDTTGGPAGAINVGRILKAQTIVQKAMTQVKEDVVASQGSYAGKPGRQQGASAARLESNAAPAVASGARHYIGDGSVSPPVPRQIEKMYGDLGAGGGGGGGGAARAIASPPPSATLPSTNHFRHHVPSATTYAAPVVEAQERQRFPSPPPQRMQWPQAAPPLTVASSSGFGRSGAAAGPGTLAGSGGLGSPGRVFPPGSAGGPPVSPRGPSAKQQELSRTLAEITADLQRACIISHAPAGGGEALSGRPLSPHRIK